MKNFKYCPHCGEKLPTTGLEGCYGYPNLELEELQATIQEHPLQNKYFNIEEELSKKK